MIDWYTPNGFRFTFGKFHLSSLTLCVCMSIRNSILHVCHSVQNCIAAGYRRPFTSFCLFFFSFLSILNYLLFNSSSKEIDLYEIDNFFVWLSSNEEKWPKIYKVRNYLINTSRTIQNEINPKHTNSPTENHQIDSRACFVDAKDQISRWLKIKSHRKINKSAWRHHVISFIDQMGSNNYWRNEWMVYLKENASTNNNTRYRLDAVAAHLVGQIWISSQDECVSVRINVRTRNGKYYK